jgi:hypothetical protein
MNDNKTEYRAPSALVALENLLVAVNAIDGGEDLAEAKKDGWRIIYRANGWDFSPDNKTTD